MLRSSRKPASTPVSGLCGAGEAETTRGGGAAGRDGRTGEGGGDGASSAGVAVGAAGGGPFGSAGRRGLLRGLPQGPREEGQAHPDAVTDNRDDAQDQEED